MFEDKNAQILKQFERLSKIYSEQLWPRQNLYIRRLNRARKNNHWLSFELPPSPDSSDYDSFFIDIILENTHMLMLYDQLTLITKENSLLKEMTTALNLVNSELSNEDS
jgi:hypothetical protein